MHADPPDLRSWSPAEKEFQALLRRFAQICPAVYVVGGAVRDALITSLQSSTPVPSSWQPSPSQQNHAMDQQSKVSDVDLVLPESACDFARKVADLEGWAFYKLDAERDIARLVYTDSVPPLVCDVARFQGESLAEDLAVRDFSINAMAFQLSPDSHDVSLIDNHDGVDDIRNGQIRRIHESGLLNDPNRFIRAVRLAVQLGYSIEEETYNQIRDNAQRILDSSQERIRDELWKGMATSRSAAFIELLRQSNLLKWVLPEVAELVDVSQSAPHHLDVYRHTLLAVRHAGFLRDWILRDNGLDFAVDSCPTQPKSSSPQSDPSRQLVTRLKAWHSQLQHHLGQELAAGHSVADWLVWYALFHDVGKPSTRTEEYTVLHAGEHAGKHIGEFATEDSPETGIGDNKSGTDGKSVSVRYRFFEHEHVGARLTEKRLTALHFSRDEIKVATRVVDGHMRPHHLNASFNENALSRRATYRFFRDMGQSANGSLIGIDVLLVALADVQSIYRGLGGQQLLPLATLDFGLDDFEIDVSPTGHSSEEHKEEHALVTPTTDELAHWEKYLTHIDQLFTYCFDDDGIPAITQPRLVDGRQLMAHLDMEPGPQLGVLLEQIAEAQAAGDIDSVESALEWAAKQLASTTK